jgi:hypothetical protein
MKPTLIKQQAPHDCGAACVATVLGMRTAEQAYKFFGSRMDAIEFDGVSDAELMQVLNTMDITYRYYATAWTLPAGNNLPTSRQLASKMNADVTCMYIAGVPSLNTKGSWHFVVVYKGEIYDPSTKKTYNGTADILDPVCVIQILKELK